MTARVFVVDDEPGIVALCERRLRQAGFAVQGFVDPREALRQLRTMPPDAMLLDIRMPEMEGFEVLEEVRRIAPQVAVVIITGYASMEMAVRALWAGADGLLLKPFEQGKQIVEAVEEALRLRQRKQAQLRAEALRPLFDVTEMFISETRPARLRQMVVQAAQGVLKAEVAGLVEEHDGPQVTATVGMRVPESLWLAHDGVLWTVWRRWVGQIVTREDVVDDAQARWWEQVGLKVIMAVPVMLNPERRFLLWVGRCEEARPWMPADLELLGILARHAAVALENAALHERQREMLRQLEASQQALVQAEKMAAMGRLMATVAHEVNNPLQALKNCLELAQRSELSAQEREEFLHLATEELQRLQDTVQRLLDYFRPGAVQRRAVAFREVLDKVLNLLRKRCEEQQVTVLVEVPEDLPPVLVVPAQIQQVLLNLALNALDVMPHGGELGFRAWVEGNFLRVAVRDSGPGIPPEVQRHIFEPFYSTKEEGTGLGLSVSYGILTAHGGDLRLAHTSPRGTEFHLLLPLAQVAKEVVE